MNSGDTNGWRACGSRHADLTRKLFDEIRTWLAAGVQGTTIHAGLQRNHGYTGSYCAVKRMLRRLATERGVATTTILDFAPGDVVQVDFGAGPVLTVEGIAGRT